MFERGFSAAVDIAFLHIIPFYILCVYPGPAKRLCKCMLCNIDTALPRTGGLSRPCIDDILYTNHIRMPLVYSYMAYIKA